MKITKDFTKILKGISDISEVVGSTMGVGGANVLMAGFPTRLVTNDGKRVAETYRPLDIEEREGALRAVSAANSTASVAGDGTSATVVLLNGFLSRAIPAIKDIDDGTARIDFLRGMEDAVNDTCDHIASLAVLPEDPEVMGQYVRSVVNIAMHGDARAEKIGTLVHEVGAGGSIELDQSKTGEFYTEKTNGYSWEGMVVPDPSFFTTPKAAVYENALVAVVGDKLATVEEVKSLFDAYQLKCSVRNAKNEVEAVIPQPLVFVFNDLSGDALRVFQLRRHRDSGQPLPCVVVCAPGDSEMERLQYMKDIAAFTGATYFNKRDGKNMKAFSPSDLGRVKKVVANLSTCVLTEQETPLSASMKKEMVQLLENTIKSEKNETVKAFWQKRLNKLMSKVGTIFIAPKTEGEYLYDSELCEDAYRAGMAAMEEGVIPGCGVTLLHFSESKHTYYAYIDGYAAAKEAMKAPFCHILSNAGASLDVITSGIAFFSDKGVDMTKTFDAETFDEVNAIEAGILDTKRGVTAALRNAWSECQKIANSKFIIING